MKNFDLESKIKAIPVPERGKEYWEEFPDRVLTELRATPARRQGRLDATAGWWWGGRVALTCLMLGFCLWQSRLPRALSRAVRRNEQQLRASVERFECHVDRVMQDDHGMRYLLEEKK